MVCKIHKRVYNHSFSLVQYGITYVDIIVTIGIVMVLIAVILVIINPVELQKKGRDNKRISDISVLDRAISEYSLDKKSYPDAPDVTRTSNVLPVGNVGPFTKASDGWIDANMTSYSTVLPVDPLNDNSYHYTYRHTSSGYELNAVLEYLTTPAQNDGGNAIGVYEVGNDLSIL